MEYEIREFGSFEMAGVVRRVSTVNGENYKVIPKFFEEMDENGTIKSLLAKTSEKGLLKGSLLGVCMDYEEKTEEFNFMIAVEPESGSDVKGLETRSVPAQTWAVFPGKGKMPESIQSVWKRIFSEWFPSMDYIHAEGPELEVYLPGPGDPDECPFEVWIPIEKK